MQKLIRTSAIVAVALKAAASTLILMSYFFQPIIIDLFYNSSPSDGGSIFLIFIQSLWSLFATIPLLFCCGKQKGRIVLELIVFGLLSLDHHQQAYRLDIRQRCHGYLQRKGQRAQHTEQRHLLYAQGFFSISQWYTPA